MRNINTNWRIMNNEDESPEQRALAEADVRECAYVGMFPTLRWTSPQVAESTVLAACQRVRMDLGLEIGPQPIRFEPNELAFLIGLVASVEDEVSAKTSVLARLRHRDKTMRTHRNADTQERDPNDISTATNQGRSRRPVRG